MAKTFGLSLLLLAVAAWAVLWQFDQFWGSRNEILADQIRARLTQLVPDWRIEFSRAELLDNAFVKVYDVKVGGKTAPAPLLEIPQLDVQLDQELFAEGLQVLITGCDAHEPVLHLLRDESGEWNIRDLPRLPQNDRPTPAIHIHDGRVRVSLAASEYLPETELQLTSIESTLSPSAYRQYRIDGSTSVDTAGALKFTGSFDLASGRWDITGLCHELKSPDGLLKLAAGVSPETKQQLDTLAQQQTPPVSAPRNEGQAGNAPWRVATDDGTGAPIQAAADTNVIRDVPSRCELPALGVAANLQVAFHLESPGYGALLEYVVGARISDGSINNPALPVPLHDLSGELFVDNSQIVIKELQASNGESRLFVDGRLARAPLPPARSFTVKAVNLTFGRDIHQHIPPGGLLKVYECLRPEGRFNVDVAAETDGVGGWKVTLNQFEAYHSSVLPDVFAYPIQDIRGRIWQEGDRFLCDFAGRAGNRPVKVDGSFENPGPNLTADIRVQVDQLVIDDALRSAFVQPQHLKIREALEKLRLSGLVDADIRLVKSGVTGEKVQLQLDADVRAGGMNYIQFPYRVEDLRAHIKCDPLSPDPGRRDTWYFTDIRGRHGSATITGNGSFAQRSGRPLLDLQLTALEVPVDRELEFAAIQCNPVLRNVFDSVGRAGSVDLEGIRVLWTPDVPVAVALPRIILKDATVQLVQFPYPWEHVNATLSWESSRLSIANLNGWHGRDTYLQIDNAGKPETAVFELPQQGEVNWHLHLEEIRVKKLMADRTFRAALPRGVAGVVDQFNPTAPLDLLLGLDLKGFRNQPDLVTAAWSLKLAVTGGALDAGVNLADVEGEILIPYGSYDGEKSFVEGTFRFDRAKAFGLPFTQLHGPFQLDGDELFVGSPNWKELNRAPNYQMVRAEQAQADIYSGKLGFDVHVQLPHNEVGVPEYRAEVNLRNAQLSAWAKENGLTAERLYGDVNGRIDWMTGQGSSDRTIRGTGWLQISPAQLFELPVLNPVIAALEMSRPDVAAFRYAYGDFKLHDGLFDFSKILLVGESLTMGGAGYVAFGEGLNEQVNIEFYQSRFRNRIPVLNAVWGTLSKNSIGVLVTGTVRNPVRRDQVKFGIIDDTLRNLIDNFDPGPGFTPPRALMGQPPQSLPSGIAVPRNGP